MKNFCRPTLFLNGIVSYILLCSGSVRAQISYENPTEPCVDSNSNFHCHPV